VIAGEGAEGIEMEKVREDQRIKYVSAKHNTPSILKKESL
jgi:hypothetical protein